MKSSGESENSTYTKCHFPIITSSVSLNLHRIAQCMSQILNEVLFYMLLTCSVVVAFNLAAFDSNKAINLETIMAFYNLFCILATTFVYCYLAEEVTSILLDIGNTFYHSIWYEWPAEQQQIVILVIQRASKAFRLKSMGLIDCSLYVFSSVGL